ncbi:MAG: entericidin A/B family lipoprotein [Verrucomicrobiaceae bacterium]|nr:MAG: entericidin A/B family lipoprotein [Verrucomicrobiaceae bacterium]
MKNNRASLLSSVLILTGSLLACGWLSSCRTTEGFGQDLQKVGNKIENEAYKRG